MKKLLSVILALTMVLGMAVPAFADDISSSGGTSSVPVTLNSLPATFSVTVPTNFPVDIQADGTVSYASNLMLFNNGKGQIKITNIQVSGANSWSLAAFDTDFTKLPTNTKSFGFKICGNAVPANGTADLTGVKPIDGYGIFTVPYEANVAVQSSTVEDVQIANVVFTVAWNTAA